MGSANPKLQTNILAITGVKSKIQLFLAILFLATAVAFFGKTKLVSAACTAPGTDYGTVTSTISVPATGTYRVWSRIMSGTAATDNSYLLEVDGGSCFTVGDNNSMATGSWQWVDYSGGSTSTKINLTNLSAGNHTFKMIGREDGVKLDRIIITQDTLCTPTGTGDNCANPPDTTPPTVSMSQPANNATVSGTTGLQSSASDDSGTVSSVSYYIDGSSTAVGTATTSPYTVNWNTTTVADGTHTITAKAIDPSGNIASSSAITVTVNNAKPDLIVTGITYTPATPATGNQVTFSATIRNQGAAATPNGVIHGIAFSVDGTVVSWADNYTTSIAPGATATLTANAGPSGSTWTATSGTHTILANLDDLNRISESNETNNTFTISLTPGASDTTAPSTAITAFSNSNLRGTATVNATASDSVGVTKVEFYVDGVLKTTDTGTPYTYSWDTTTATNGSHTLTTKAYDAAGNIGTSAGVVVTVDNVAPTTSITAPANGSTQSGTLTITANAADAVGIAKVELYIDGNLSATDVATPFAFSLNTTLLTNGTHTLTTRAYDLAGNTTNSTGVSITVNNAVSVKTGDVNGDNSINALDASIILFNWGKSGMTRTQGDLNNDGTVNVFDASLLLANWGK